MCAIDKINLAFNNPEAEVTIKRLYVDDYSTKKIMKTFLKVKSYVPIK